MKKLILLLLVIFAGCEATDNERQFDVTVRVENWISYEIEFPNLPASETNPLRVVRTQPYYEQFTTVAVTSPSPLTIRAKHGGTSDWIFVEIHENGKLLKADSAFGKYKEIWVNYEW
jgi:hypothetical protein